MFFDDVVLKPDWGSLLFAHYTYTQLAHSKDVANMLVRFELFKLYKRIICKLHISLMFLTSCR